MQKIFDHLEIMRKGEKAIPSRFVDMSVSKEIKQVDHSLSKQIEWTVSLKLWRKMIGPVEAHDLFMEETRRAMSREIFGDLKDDCLALLKALYDETYRPPDDPAVMLVEKMLNKIEGNRT